MKPAPFDYVRASSVDDALAALAEGDAKVLAGGQSLVPMMNMRLARPARLVDINRLDGLAGIAARDDGGLLIGALVRHTELVTSPLVRERAPLLAAAAAHVGHRAIRNRGTIGGSVAHADPAAELPAALLALDATFVVAAHTGRRRLAARDFFVGLLATALAGDEMLVEIEVPASAGGWGFAEVARRAGDFAIAGVTAMLATATTVRLVAFGADDRPIRLAAAEHLIENARITSEIARRAGTVAAAECRPSADVHGSAEYRRHLVGVLVERALGDAMRRRDGATPERTTDR